MQYQKINNLKLKIYKFAQHKTVKHYHFVFAIVVYFMMLSVIQNMQHQMIA